MTDKSVDQNHHDLGILEKYQNQFWTLMESTTSETKFGFGGSNEDSVAQKSNFLSALNR